MNEKINYPISNAQFISNVKRALKKAALKINYEDIDKLQVIFIDSALFIGIFKIVTNNVTRVFEVDVNIAYPNIYKIKDLISNETANINLESNAEDKDLNEHIKELAKILGTDEGNAVNVLLKAFFELIDIDALKSGIIPR